MRLSVLILGPRTRLRVSMIPIAQRFRTRDGLETNDVGRSARGTRPNAGNFACITPEQWPSAALSKEAFNGKQPRGQDALLAESKELKPDSQPPIPALSPPSAAGKLEEAPCTTSVCCAEGRIRFRIRDSGWW